MSTLPDHFSKLVIHQLTGDFRSSTSVTTQAWVDPGPGEVVVLHCLPAHRNHELTDEVADGLQSVIFPQAHNRLHAQKAIMARLFGVA